MFFFPSKVFLLSLQLLSFSPSGCASFTSKLIVAFVSIISNTKNLLRSLPRIEAIDFFWSGLHWCCFGIALIDMPRHEYAGSVFFSLHRPGVHTHQSSPCAPPVQVCYQSSGQHLLHLASMFNILPPILLSGAQGVKTLGVCPIARSPP